MITLLTIVHVVVCIFLIGIVLLQHGKGADMGATFGGSSQTVFGTDGPLPLLNKITTISAIIFMMTSVTLAYNSAHQTNGSVMKSMRPEAPIEQQQQEITPAPPEIPLQRGSEDSAAPPAADEATPAAPESMEKAPATFPGTEEENAPAQE